MAELVGLVTRNVLQQLQTSHGAPMPEPGSPDGLGSLGLNPSAPGALVARLDIAGVELTQSTQYSAAAGHGYGPDNGVPLVALKTLVARAYPVVVPGLLSPDQLTGQRVTGELLVSVGDRVVYRTGPTRSDGARVGRQRNLDRTLWDREYSVRARTIHSHSLTVNTPLNFVVPAYYCRPGRASVSVRLWTPDSGTGASWSDYVWFTDVEAPRMCLVRVNWTDGSRVRSSPSDADMLASLSVAERMLPFPYFETTVLSLEVDSTAAFGALPSSPGACNTAWDSLVADLAVTGIFTALFGLGDLVIGFVPSAALPASGPYVGGCGRGGIGTFVGQPVTIAHELGHLFQRNHVAVAGDPSNDVNYPNYGGDVRSIGEVGVDTGTWPPTVYDPDSSDDLMSYGSNQWISPYTYQAILNVRGLHPSARARPSRVYRPLLVVAVRMFRDRSIELRRVLAIEAPGQVPRQWEGASSPLSVDVLDANGKVLFTHHLLAVPARGCGGCGSGCGGPVPRGREPWQDFDEAIEWPEGARSLSFHDGGDPLLVVDSGEAPHLEVSEPERGESDLRFHITARHPRATPSIAVLFTGDGGQSWWPIAFDPPDGAVVVTVSSLPSRGQSRFKVIATADLLSTVVETGTVDLPSATRQLHLLLPDQACGIPAGPVPLRVRIDLRGHALPSPRELHWSSSIDGDLGTGPELVAELSAGTHAVTVTAPDGVGGTLAEHGIIIVSG